MRRLSRERVLSNDRAFCSATKETAPRAPTSNRESHFRRAAWTRPARTINRSLARDVDLAAINRDSRNPIAASLRISVHPSQNHARRLSWEWDRKTNYDPPLVLAWRTGVDCSAIAAPPRVG